MTTTETEIVGQPGGEPTAAVPPSSSALRRSAAIRVGIAVALAAGLTATAIAAPWSPLSGKSDVVGYPIVADFNPTNYARAYYLTVGLFPIAALLIFLGLTRIWPRLGLAVPAPRGRLRPLVTPPNAEPSPDREPSLRVNCVVAAGARVALVGAVLGLEFAVATIHVGRSIVLATIGYSLLVVVGSIALGRLTSARSSWEERLATLNSLGAPLTVAGLSLVSAHTGVRVLSSNSVHHYTWFPAWFGVPLAAALFAWILASLRRAGAAKVTAIERRSVLLIAAPVALVVLTARLPGDLGPIGLYEQGQFVTETMLVVQHGWLPWRDVVVVHGLLGDVLPTTLGWGVFGNSLWGDSAGLGLICFPLAIVSTYFLLAYLVGRSWPLLVIAASIFLGTWLGTIDVRFVLWPMVLLLLAALLKRFTIVRAPALGFLTVLQAILTPEMTAAIPIVALVVAAYEWYWRPPGTRFVPAFRRTIWFAIAAALTGVVFAIYMASRGALGDVISVTLDLLVGHWGLATPPIRDGVSHARYDFIALAPVVSLLISSAYAVIRLRLRRPFLLADWPMAAVALYLLFYYTKFLTFMDLPHAYQPFLIATPLMIYIVYRAITAVELWVRTRMPERHAGWMTAHPVGIIVLIGFLVLFWGTLRREVELTPTAYRPIASDPPIPHVGYAAQYDSATVDDLRQIVNAYLGPHDRLMDITNEPGLFYYWLGRDPSSRWFAPGGGLTSTPRLQRLLIDDLRRDPPKLIVFDDVDTVMYGLPAFDGVPNNVFAYLVGRWILRHYRPLLESHNRSIYALPRVRPVSSLHLHLQQQPATTGVPFRGQACIWGDAPTFLTSPGEPPAGAQRVPVRSAFVRETRVTLTGWAGDMRTREPARQVIATLNGRIVGRATPYLERDDVPAAGLPAGFLHSGFRLSIPAWANASKALRVLAIGRGGSVGPLGLLNAPLQGGTAKIGDRTVALDPTADTGHVDAEAASGPLVQIRPPAGTMWADYRWLEVDAPRFGGFLPGGFVVTDEPDAIDPAHSISFNTLASSPRRYVIPVSSCAQWMWGYASRPLYLVSSPPQEVGGARLIR